MAPDGSSVSFEDIVKAETDDERGKLIRELVSRMTLREKIREMSGTETLFGLLVKSIRYGLSPFRSGGIKRFGIPPIKFTDGPRGICTGHSTCFPVAIARAATWDVELEEKVGEIMGIEARAQGANFFGGICINILRHPGWGRAQETFGEDPYLLGEMGVATLNGAQKHLMACVKHFACNSIEESRFFVNVLAGERALREIYLPHFKRCVDAGVASVMSAYNRLNGNFCGENRVLLRKILKEEWGFQGLVMSDFLFGIRDGVLAACAGLDVEMPKKWRFGFGFSKAVREGKVPAEFIDDSVSRVIRQKARFAKVGLKSYEKSLVACQSHVDVALEAARKGIVLLKNDDGVLPLKRKELKKILVVGKLSKFANIGDKGSSRVHPPYVVTPLEGIKRVAGSLKVQYEKGNNLRRVSEKAKEADACIVFAGLTHADEGEFIPIIQVGGKPIVYMGGDRENLALSPAQENLINLVASSGKRVIVVLEGGSPILVESWKDKVDAILMAWYPGMEGGTAIAEILFGDVCPSGKLPITFPESSEQLPDFKARVKEIEYDLHHGYWYFEKEGIKPSFPFGFGLSYTTFAYDNLRIEPRRVEPSGVLQVTFNVENTGSVSGSEVAQVYLSFPRTSVERPSKLLKGFARIQLEPGEKKTVSISIPAAELAYYDERTSCWKFEETTYLVHVGSSSREEDLFLRGEFELVNSS